MWFKGIQCFPEALLLLSVGGGVTLRGREINIYREWAWGWECAADTERLNTGRERWKSCVSLPPACLAFTLFLFFFKCLSFFLLSSFSAAGAAAPVASPMKWSNRSPNRFCAMLVSHSFVRGFYASKSVTAVAGGAVFFGRLSACPILRAAWSE